MAYSSSDLAERTIHRRAIEAVIWGMPIVNFDLMAQAAARMKAVPNQIIYWSQLPDWKNQTLTPNPDAVYLLPLIDTKRTGPMVLEIPPASDDRSITGSIDDCWQTAVEDVGPVGADKGKGGKYLLLPPNSKDKVPDGYLVMSPVTHQSYCLARSILKSGSNSDIADAVNYGRQIKLYPLSQAAKPPATVFIDAIGRVFDSTIPYDLTFFKSLNRMVQHEPWLERDKAMIDPLKTIGMQKGKPFSPDVKTQAILREAISEAHNWIEAQYDSVFSPPFNEGSQWALPASQELVEGLGTNFAESNSYPTDARGLAFSYAFFSAKHLGAGQFT